MRRTTDASEILVRYVVNLMKILATYEIFIRYDTLNSGKYEFVANTRLQLLKMTLEVRRRGDKHQRVVLLRNTIQIAIEVNLIDIEVYTGEVGGVMPHATEILDTVVATHIPTYMVCMTYHNLGNSCCPAATSDNCYLTTIVHGSLNIDH